MYDRKWLEMQIVRMGERFPKRVGDRTLHGDNPCMIGLIALEQGGDFNAVLAEIGTSGDLVGRTAQFNDWGVPWGQIPVRLGLVPGEVLQDETVGVCQNGPLTAEATYIQSSV